MGEVIRSGASADDIMADVRTSWTNATAKGGRWKELADQRLSSVVAFHDNIQAQVKGAGDLAAPLHAKVEAENDRADRLLGKVSDDVWNAVGRPASDPALSLLFPGGIGYYANGDVAGQPDRMDVLAQLLVSGIHPRLSQEDAQAAAAQVTDASASLRAAVEAARAPLAKVGVLERVHTSIARAARNELVALKRLYKVEGFSEAEIHKVIPDRPSAKSGAAAAQPSPPQPAAPDAAPAQPG